MINILRKSFSPIFFLLFLFSFFLIEGDYKFYLFGLWSLFLLFFNKIFNRDGYFTNKFIIKIALFLSLLFTISLFFSKHIPLSLEKLLFYLTSFSIFVFFLNLPKKQFKLSLFFYYLSIISLILNLLVIFFTFFYQESNLFPGMNLLLRTYGHNHYAAFLLLVIPVFWWQFLFGSEENWISKKEIKFLAIILLSSSYLIMFFSLGRLALIISLLQLIFIFFQNKKAFVNFGMNKTGYMIVKSFIFSFLLISFLFLSLSFKTVDGGSCPLIFSNKELCKPLIENDRFIYWERAVLIFKENILFGSGLKNFNFASRAFPSENYRITSYSHNIFLDNFAEGGIFTGAFFLFFISYLFYRSFLLLKLTDNPLYKFLFLASVASLTNSLLDFDWNFFVIFTLTLVFLAIILSLEKEPDIFKERSTISINKYFALLATLTCFVSFSYLTSLILLKNNKYDLVFKFFPYFDGNIRNLIGVDKITSQNYEKLYFLYKNDPDFLYKFSKAKDLEKEKKVELQVELAEIDPAFFIKIFDFEKIDYKTAKPLAEKLMEVSTNHQFLNNHYFFDYWEQRNAAVDLFMFANQAYDNGDVELSAYFYKQAVILNPFIMGDLKASFLEKNDDSKAAAFLNYFKDFNPEKMGKYFYEYMSFYERVLIYLFKNNQQESFFILSEAMFKQQHNFSWFLFQDLIVISKTKEEKQRLKQVHNHFQDMTTWSDFLPLP